jgi:hypothetical protein
MLSKTIASSISTRAKALRRSRLSNLLLERLRFCVRNSQSLRKTFDFQGGLRAAGILTQDFAPKGLGLAFLPGPLENIGQNFADDQTLLPTHRACFTKVEAVTEKRDAFFNFDSVRFQGTEQSPTRATKAIENEAKPKSVFEDDVAGYTLAKFLVAFDCAFQIAIQKAHDALIIENHPRQTDQLLRFDLTHHSLFVIDGKATSINNFD